MVQGKVSAWRPFLPFPYSVQPLSLSGRHLGSGPECTVPALTHREASQVSLATPPPSVKAKEGQHPRALLEAGRETWTKKMVLELRSHTKSLDPRLLLPLRNASSCPAASWKKKKRASHSSDSVATLEPESLLNTKRKGKKTQAGCKLFESFVRRGIFPVKCFFFLLKVCFKIKRAREKS